MNTFHYSARTKLPTAARLWLKITSSGNFPAPPTQSYLSLGLMERNAKPVFFQVNTEYKQRQMVSNLQDKSESSDSDTLPRGFVIKRHKSKTSCGRPPNVGCN